MKAQTGFTLLEVLIALAVLAIAMGAIISAATQSINTVATLRDQTFASWVALNQVHALLLESKPWPDEAETRSGKAELANRVWRWEARFSKTEDPDLRRLDLSVRAGENGPELVRRVAFRAKAGTARHRSQCASGRNASGQGQSVSAQNPEIFAMSSTVRGFTLLELLVALAVFAIMSVAPTAACATSCLPAPPSNSKASGWRQCNWRFSGWNRTLSRRFRAASAMNMAKNSPRCLVVN
ncbi:MAG: type II secretion system minor pseudopilin GspI [Synechococcaceae cyanobacterium SM1_2_3]|nr:type II secretion system minor pseudopilin GspI [Synechococcaceae cyanobacterium SM1_2_3]